jgi:hypothetical protein
MWKDKIEDSTFMAAFHVNDFRKKEGHNQNFNGKFVDSVTGRKRRLIEEKRNALELSDA